jgi:uncharacterized protein
MEQLIEISNRLLKSTLSSFTRSLYSGINWQNRLIEIRGARGVGKTTLMLQRAKRLLEQGTNPLYLSLDNAFFYGNQLFETVDTFCKYGGTHIFIDEVHRYPRKEKGLDWSQEIKNVSKWVVKAKI